MLVSINIRCASGLDNQIIKIATDPDPKTTHTTEDIVSGVLSSALGDNRLDKVAGGY